MSVIGFSQSLIVTVAIAVCGASGCATMVAGGPDRVAVSTIPSGAAVFVDNKPVGQTPVVVQLDRRHDNGEFRLELAGFQSIRVTRAKGFNGWFMGNVLFGGLIGVVIDIATGNIIKFDDAPIAVKLTPSDGRAVAVPPPMLTTWTPCRAERHRILVEAKQIEDQYERVKMINSAPTC